MSFSGIAVEHREKQAQAQTFLLIYSMIGSLALHIGLLTLGIENFFNRVPKVEDKPMELTIIEAPTPEVTKPPEKPKLPPKVNSGGGGGGNGIENETAASMKTATAPVIKQRSVSTAPAPVAQPIHSYPVPFVKQPQIQTASLQKLVDNSKIPVLEQPEPKVTVTPQTTSKVTPPPVSTPSVPPSPSPIPIASTTQNADNFKTPPQQPQSLATVKPHSKPLAQFSKPISIPSSAPSPTPLPFPSSTQLPLASGKVGGTGVSNSLGNALAHSLRNRSGNGFGNGVGSGFGNGVGNGVSSGSGNGRGNGSGNSIGNGVQEGSRVATDPKPPKPKSTRLNSTDCIKCEIKYPERAKRRGIEGNPEVTIDYDENGKVTNVQLTRPSGKSELDEALMEQARDFQLKPTATGKQGVRVSANFVISGSDRQRELQARQKKRKAEQRQRETLTNTPSATEEPDSSNQP